MSRLPRFLRYVLWIGLGAYFAIALAYLGLRYWVAPNIDNWRPEIVQQFSQRFGVQLTVQRIQLGWSGAGPAFELHEVQLRNGQGGRVLSLPEVRGSLSWWGLWRGELRFHDLTLQGLDIAVHRDAQQRLTLFSDSEDTESPPEALEEDPGVGLNHPLVQWLSQQKHVVLSDASVVWTDEARDGTPLALEGVTIAWLHEGDRYSLGVVGQPPHDTGREFQLKGEFTQVDTKMAMEDPKAWDAQLYISVQEMAPKAWRAWVDIPEQIESGRLTAQWWLAVKQGQPADMVLDARLEQGRWSMSESGGVDVAAAHIVVDGDWRAYMDIYEDAIESGALVTPGQVGEANALVDIWLDVSGLKLELPSEFAQALDIDELELKGSLMRDEQGQLGLALTRAHISNADMDVSLSGRWRPDARSESGWADLQGVFARADMAAIVRYMPLSVEAEARDWMRTGLLGGVIHDAGFLVRGELDDFPFGDERAADAKGAWRLDGRYEGGVMDYAPAYGKQKGWPRLEAMQGQISMRGNDLRLVAQSALMHPAAGQSLQLQDVQAQIPDLAHETTLNLQGQTQADATAYLALLQHSPLGGLLGHTFDETRASGQWKVPLQLTIPLLDAEASRVRGQVQFDGGKVYLFDDMPVFDAVTGALDFSEWGATTQGLNARFLGGSVVMRGGLGKGQTALGANGRVTMAAIKQMYGLDQLSQVSGELAYQVRLVQQSGGRYGLTGQSNLVGLASTLPAPMSKTAQTAWPLRASWMPYGRGKAMMLEVELPGRALAKFVHDPAKPQVYFQTAALGVGRQAELPNTGLAIDAQSSFVDLEAWNSIVDSFHQEGTGAVSKRKPVWPELENLRVQADHVRMWGLDMNQATVTARREKDSRWRLDIASTETAGTLFWREANGATEGMVQAHFARMRVDAWGDDAESPAQEDASAWEMEGDLDLPGIQLKVDDFVVAGRHLGALALEGINVSRGRLWRLEALSLSSPAATLNGHGEWRLDGQDRGLTLQAEAKVKDAGAYLKQVGVDDVLHGGAGTLQAQLVWAHLPWRFDVKDIQGTIKLDLLDGRFSAVQSRTVKVLELLSMQSLQRVLSFSLKPGDLFGSGFAFDSWSGNLHLDNGIIQTNDYRVEGAAGTINLAGSTRWDTEALDLQAMVVPRLDVSGASLAAGFVVNPIVGLGAFLTQWALKEPLARAMTVHYEVKGTWKDPQIKEVSVSEAASGGKAASEESVR